MTASHLIHDIGRKFANSVFAKITKLERSHPQSTAFYNDVNQRFLGKTAVSWFLEPSTRTAVSFELASLSMKYVRHSHEQSSASKGELNIDALAALAAMEPNFIIIRSNEEGIFEHTHLCGPNTSIINAGCSNITHPCQALSDCYLIQKHVNNIEDANIVICGDASHSRVAHSNYNLLRELGAKNIGIYSSDKVMTDTDMANNPSKNPSKSQKRDWGEGCIQYSKISDFIHNADIIMLLRAQKERHTVNLNQYKEHLCLTSELLKMTKPGCKFMHPGPVNRDVEIATDITYCDKSLILDQVRYGVLAKIAVLDSLQP